jgi:hypothetical protein
MQFQMFRRIIVPAPSGISSLVRLPDPEDEGTTTLQNVNNCTTSKKALLSQQL